MKSNVSPIDGVLRLIVAILFIVYSIMFGPWWLMFFSIPFVATAVLNWCALYEMLGINTNWQENQLPKPE